MGKLLTLGLFLVCIAVAHAEKPEGGNGGGGSSGGGSSSTTQAPQGGDDNGGADQTSMTSIDDETPLQQNLPTGNGFKNDSELGFVSSEGNSNAQSTNLQQKNSYLWSGNTLSGTYNFLRSESNGVESARRWTASLLFERDVTKSWGYYFYQGYQSDTYAGYELRSNSEVGARYTHNKSNTFQWFSYVGYRYTEEQRVEAPHQLSDYAHLYTEFTNQWSPTLSSEIWVEYLPNFSQHKDYMLNGEASMYVMLTRILSLKTSYELMYNNSPPPHATHQRDSLLTNSLVARF